MDFQELLTDSKILQALQDLGFTKATPIQEKAIPEILKGSDLRASAQTGSGKTAAYLLPILSKLGTTSPRGPRVLILVPTRELALQVSAESVKLSRHLPHIKTVSVYGGVPYRVQNRQLSKKYDILIATPGRLIDYLEQKRISLNHIELFILDEADRMLDMGFIDPVEEIAARTPQTRQTLLFSATYGKKVIQLAENLLQDPVEIMIESETPRQGQIEQHLHPSTNLEHKFRLLEFVLSEPKINQAIVFSATKHQTEEIAERLCDKGFQAGALHGDMNQNQRTRMMQKLRDGRIRILVATDVAARGIDVQTISHVINFDLPQTLDDYIHRIGRTGRAGAKGTALSFASPRDHQIRKAIERFANLTTIPLPIPGFTPSAVRPDHPKPKRHFKRPFKRKTRS